MKKIIARSIIIGVFTGVATFFAVNNIAASLLLVAGIAVILTLAWAIGEA